MEIIIRGNEKDFPLLFSVPYSKGVELLEEFEKKLRQAMELKDSDKIIYDIRRSGKK